MPLIELKNVRVSYQREPALENISFVLERGETFAVIGPNGSGKTTLLRAILGIVPFEGKIQWEKKNIRIGYVPQKLDLERDLPLSVEEFLLLHPRQGDRGYSPREVVEMVRFPSSYLGRPISNLSAGEFQRVLIAFALMAQPDLLLFDEPTANVDIGGQETVYELLHNLQDLQRFALILISHDLSLVYHYANTVLCLNKVQVCVGPPQEVLTPQELEKLYGGGRRFYHHLHGEP